MQFDNDHIAVFGLFFLFRSINVADVGELPECLCLLINAFYNFDRCILVVFGNVVINVSKP